MENETQETKRRRWEWIPFLLAMLLTFFCVFTATAMALMSQPDKLEDASMLPVGTANYGQLDSEKLRFGQLDNAIFADATQDSAGLSLTPGSSGEAAGNRKTPIYIAFVTPVPSKTPVPSPMVVTMSAPGTAVPTYGALSTATTAPTSTDQHTPSATSTSRASITATPTRWSSPTTIATSWPTVTPTNVPAPTFTSHTPKPTSTRLPVPSAATNTAIPPNTATAVSPASTNTPTSVPSTATPTAINTPPNTATALPPTATNTETAVPPTTTNTATAVPPTATNTATTVPPTATNTATATAVPPTATSPAACSGSVPAGEPNLGPPNTILAIIPCGQNITVDLGVNAIVVTGAEPAFDFVFYELENPPTLMLLDWVIIEASVNGVDGWVQVFNWGNDVLDGNSNIGQLGHGASGEPDNYEMPMTDLYGGYSTGVAIDFDAVVPPGIYQWIRISSPLGGASDGAEVDSIEVIP